MSQENQSIKIYFQMKDGSYHLLDVPDSFPDVLSAEKFAGENKWLGNVKIVQVREKILKVINAGIRSK